MGKTREIKDRMKAVANIRRITKTMQMIATARFQASQRRAVAAQPYTQKIAELVGELGGGGAVDHPLLCAPETPVGRVLLLVLTSNRGLCGGYNANILRSAMSVLRDSGDQKIDLEVVGKKGLAYFKFAGIAVDQFHDRFTDTPQAEAIEALAERYMTLFTQGAYDAVRVVSMSYQSASRQSPVVLSLLPIQRPVDAAADQTPPGGAVRYDFSPPPDVLIGQLLPIAVKNQLRQCFNEAAVGEHIARMVAMKSATDSAGKMGKDLTRQFNRARQAAITTELAEIIAGSAALK